MYIITANDIQFFQNLKTFQITFQISTSKF